MSEPAKAEKITPPKAATAKPKSTAPLPKQPGQSPATPTLAKLRRALGELIVGYKTGKTHMFGIYAANLRSALDAAGKVRGVATEAERKDLDGLELRARMLLIHVPGPDAKPTSDDGRLVIDWDYISDSIDQVVPGVGQVATKSPQQYRDCFEAVWRSTLYMKDAFREQWAEIQKHWFEFLYATAAVVALETAALIASALPGTQLLGIVVQALIIAFVAYAAVNIGIEASQLTDAFWLSVKEANGDPTKIDAAAAKFARLVIYILRLLAEAVAGGVLAKLSMNGIKHIAGEHPVTIRSPRTTPETPEFPVQRSQLQRTAHPIENGRWLYTIEAPLSNGKTARVGKGYAKLDPQGRPIGGPDFYIKKDAVVGDTFGKVQVYEGAKRVSLTDLVLDETIGAFKKEFGHPPDTLPGSLAFDNLTNFQRAYTKATARGLKHDAASQAAIREISFGRSRIARGYDKFAVKAEAIGEVDLGPDLGKQQVPMVVDVVARRSK